MRELRDGAAAGNGWDWSPTKTNVEFLVWSGELVCVHRDRWNRIFDLPERALPSKYLSDELTDHECLLTLLDRAGRVLGIATADDLADYLRVRSATVRVLLPETSLTPASVEGWRNQAWAISESLSYVDRYDDDAVFLGPFDNLIWYRKRVERVFNFEHALEAYKPAAKRLHGY